jgi:hypothetical protein
MFGDKSSSISPAPYLYLHVFASKPSTKSKNILVDIAKNPYKKYNKSICNIDRLTIPIPTIIINIAKTSRTFADTLNRYKIYANLMAKNLITLKINGYSFLRNGFLIGKTFDIKLLKFNTIF